MTLFTASNGTVFDLSDGAVRIQGRTPTIPAGPMGDAIREAVRHENDLRLGRWRWPNDTDFVVYPFTDQVVAVVEEKNGTSGTFTRGEYVQSDHGDAAYAYFEAHPEPQPWHLAQAGEVWALTMAGGTAPFRFDGEFFRPANDTSTAAFVPTSSLIADAERIWPKEALPL